MLKLEDVYDVVVAKDGQEAYDMVKESMSRNQFFDLIFMDIQVSFNGFGAYSASYTNCSRCRIWMAFKAPD
jgi:CheY-like chemotaxis protein